MTIISLLTLLPAALQFQPTPTPELKVLDSYLGTWKGNVEIAPPGGKAMSGPATWTFEKILDGMAVKLDLLHDISGIGKVKGHSVITWDTKKKALQCFTFSNSPSDGGAPRLEGLTVEGKALVFAATDSSPYTTVQRFELISPGKMTYSLSFSQGDKQVKVATGTLTRP